MIDEQQQDGLEEEEYLPEHTICMRAALKYCKDRFLIVKEARNTITTTLSRRIELVGSTISSTSKEAALTLPEQRRLALTQFWNKIRKKRENQQEQPSSFPEDSILFDVIDIDIDKTNDGDASSSSSSPTLSSAEQFRRRYQNGNIPCIIRGCSDRYFSNVCSQWRQTNVNDNDDDDDNINNNSPTGTMKINRSWFLNKLENDFKVPVRYQPSCSTGSENPDNNLAATTYDDADDDVIDEEGRAKECETKEMTLEKWIDLLEQRDKRDRDSSQQQQQLSSSYYDEYYLKDWHLQSHLRDLNENNNNNHKNENKKEEGGTCEENDDNDNDILLLYQVPPYFQHDLLNAFLLKFTTSGDYMFTYWGPKGSRTTLHSDVMNSFSWSFNVWGTKQWTFYPPPPPTPPTRPAGTTTPATAPLMSQEDHSNNDDTNNDNNHPPPKEKSEANTTATASANTTTPIQIIQKAGECIFVSSGWKHEVVNLEETLSINHNWITTANLDLTWDCMCCEMNSIEVELEAWGLTTKRGDNNNDESCWDARESMLRGCVGLDVSAYFFMILTRLLDIVLELQVQQQHADTIGNGDNNAAIDNNENDEFWKTQFDLVVLQERMLILLRSNDEPEAGGLICLKGRLAAVLQSKQSADEAVAMASWLTSSNIIC